LPPDLFRIGVISPLKLPLLDNQTLYRLALTRTPGIGPAYAKKLLLRFGDAESIFRADSQALAGTGIPKDAAHALLHPPDLQSLHHECRRMAQKGIRILAYTDPDYPRRLHRIPEAPPLLFYQGAANLNAEKILAIIGTRKATEYGREITQQLVRDLAESGLLIISGLALGIDAAAHYAALHYHVPTVALLGHGLDMIYPAEHWGLSRAMRHQGGLLTPFNHEIKPEKYTFAVRNELVAGLCDALIVVETGITGGSLMTVDAAFKCKKKIFAVPGRLTDKKSEGCLRLIREGKADLLVSAKQLQADLGWHWPAKHPGAQSALPFPTTASPADHQPSPTDHHDHQTPPANQHIAPSPGHHTSPKPEDELLQLLRQKDSLSIDELATVSHLDAPSLAVTLLNLELAGKVRPLPGKRYRLNH
jgi:DNA processing protein